MYRPQIRYRDQLISGFNQDIQERTTSILEEPVHMGNGKESNTRHGKKPTQRIQIVYVENSSKYSETTSCRIKTQNQLLRTTTERKRKPGTDM